jgi:hypothetical protein
MVRGLLAACNSGFIRSTASLMVWRMNSRCVFLLSAMLGFRGFSTPVLRKTIYFTSEQSEGRTKKPAREPLDSTYEPQNQNDDQDDTQDPCWRWTPSGRVWPRRQCADKQKHQDNEKNCS